MYVNPAFQADDDAAWSFVAARGFGAVVAVDNGRPVASHVPLLVTGEAPARRIELHLARANPLHHVIAGAPQVTIIVSGPDAYISPDWYVSPDQVPTWNFVAVHLSGVAAPMTPERAEAHVEALSLSFEEKLQPKKPWSTAKMTAQKRAMMLKAIVPIEIEVVGIEGAFKLSQNKTASDVHEVARMLTWRGSCGERGIAEAMRRQLKASTIAKKELA
jgi:transcriptional regulator